MTSSMTALRACNQQCKAEANEAAEVVTGDEMATADVGVGPNRN
jgi:hypothetical protein